MQEKITIVQKVFSGFLWFKRPSIIQVKIFTFNMPEIQEKGLLFVKVKQDKLNTKLMATLNMMVKSMSVNTMLVTSMVVFIVILEIEKQP